MPRRVGPYEIAARLGEGGMAETYVAVRRGPGGFEQRVCLKRPRPELERDSEFVRQFMTEAAIAARLRHTAIAQVLDFGRDGDAYYLALELIDGCDLRELLARSEGGLPAPLVLYVAIELATALDFAHRGGDGRGPVVHRDVSPSNTLVSREGEVKLTDFGIARSLGAAKHTASGIVKGKVPYMAPEYARTGRLDPRSDLFSLGVLLYECLSGVRPHDGATDLETLERAARGERVPLAERVPDAPAQLIAIVDSLLEADPELRPQSAAELLEALLALPSPARARLELGARVAACAGARPAVLAAERVPTEVLPQTAAPAGEPDWAPGAGDPFLQASATRIPRLRRGPVLALALSLACALGVSSFSLLRAGTGAPARNAAPEASAPALAPAASSVPAAAPEPVPAPEPAPAPERSRAGSPDRRALLDIVVLPYGEVAVDGKSAGASPVTVSVAPGEHTVETHSRGQKVTRRVSVAPGERKRVLLQ